MLDERTASRKEGPMVDPEQVRHALITSRTAATRALSRAVRCRARGTAILVSALIAVALGFAAAAQAATLENRDGELFYVAADGKANRVKFEEGPSLTVRVSRSNDAGFGDEGYDDDPI